MQPGSSQGIQLLNILEQSQFQVRRMDVRNQAVSSIIDPKSLNIKAKRRVRNCEGRLQRTEGRVHLTFTEKLVKRLRNGQTQEKPT